MKREGKGKKRGKKRGKLTLFGVWRHLFHESDEVEQELGVVVGQFQIIAILPGEQTRHRHVKKNIAIQHLYSVSFSHCTARCNTKWICRSRIDIGYQRVRHACLKNSMAKKTKQNKKFGR